MGFHSENNWTEYIIITDGESETEERQQETDEANEEETEDTEDEPELMDEAEKREQELFMKYLKDSPELWQQLMDSLEYGNGNFFSVFMLSFFSYISVNPFEIK